MSDSDNEGQEDALQSASDSEAPGGTNPMLRQPGKGEGPTISLDHDSSDDEIEESDGSSGGNTWALQPRQESGSGGRKRAAALTEPPGRQPKRGRGAAAAEGCARLSSFFTKLPLGEAVPPRLRNPFHCMPDASSLCLGNSIARRSAHHICYQGCCE